MYTTIIHPLRKALQLSCNEYVVLDLLSRLSHNVQYGGWCIASKQKIAEMSDLSERKIYQIINKLLELELIEKNEATSSLRTTDSFNKLMSQHDHYVIGYKDKDQVLVSGRPDIIQQKDQCSQTAKSADTILQKVQGDTAKSADYNKTYNKNIHVLPKGNTGKPENPSDIPVIESPEKEKTNTPVEHKSSSYGNPDINKMLNTIKELLALDDFKETVKMQRIHASNLVKLRDKLGREEFARRFMEIGKDEFHLKNMGSLQYIYKQIKGFVPIQKDNSIKQF